MKERIKEITPNQARNFRIEANLTQSDVAFLLEIKNIGRISEWEYGTSKPGLEHVIGLSLIYQRLESQIYYELRNKISKKIQARWVLLLQSKGQQPENGG